MRGEIELANAEDMTGKIQKVIFLKIVTVKSY